MTRSLTALRAALVASLLVVLGVLAGAAAPAQAAPAAGATAEAAKKPDPTCGPTRTRQRSVNHTFGTTVMRGTPTRIVVLEYSFVDAALAVGVRPVGVADDNNRTRILPQYRRKLGNYTSVGTRATPNLETISSLNPDLIIADSDRHAGIHRQLERIAPTIVLDSLKQAYQPNLHSAVVIGQALNKCGAMIKRLQRHRANIERIKRVIPKTERRTVMFAVTAPTIFNMHNSRSYTGSLLQVLGLRSRVQQRVGGEADQELTLETLFSLNPDILILAKSGNNTLADRWEDSPIWQQLKAVRNNQVYEVDQNLWSRWRGISAGEVMAQQTARLIYKRYVRLTIG